MVKKTISYCNSELNFSKISNNENSCYFGTHIQHSGVTPVIGIQGSFLATLDKSMP